MGMKFLNKKGWHTGSLRNIENVWKAEQKDEAEKRKLEELRKQIHEERERDEFRQLQEQAGFTPRQERLEFMYDSGLSVGKSSNEGFSALQSHPPAAQTSNSASASVAPSLDSSAPGALFEVKTQSANDAWRKLHSDPLLMIRQREQEALARIKNNPVKMAMIRKSVETKKKDDEAQGRKQKQLKSKHKKHSSSRRQSDTENDSDGDKERKRKPKHKAKEHLDSDGDARDSERRHKRSYIDNGSGKQRHGSPGKQMSERNEDRERLDDEAQGGKQKKVNSKHKRHSSSRRQSDTENDSDEDKERKRKSKHKVEEHLDSDGDSRDSERRHKHSYVNNGSEKQRHGSPGDRNEDRERLDIDEDLRDRSKHHRHSRRDYGSEKDHGSLVKQKASGNVGRERLDTDDNLRDRTKDHRHSRGDFGSEKGHRSPVKQKADRNGDSEQSRRGNERLRLEKYPSDSHDNKSASKAIVETSKHTAAPPKHDSYRGRGKAPQLSEEERAARLREMQMDAELHEEQRWKRLKKAEEDDAREASKAGASRGKSFLDAVQKSVYGAEKGGSSTIEESVRRQRHFLQGRTQVDGHNAFRR